MRRVAAEEVEEILALPDVLGHLELRLHLDTPLIHRLLQLAQRRAHLGTVEKLHRALAQHGRIPLSIQLREGGVDEVGSRRGGLGGEWVDHKVDPARPTTLLLATRLLVKEEATACTRRGRAVRAPAGEALATRFTGRFGTSRLPPVDLGAVLLVLERFHHAASRTLLGGAWRCKERFENFVEQTAQSQVGGVNFLYKLDFPCVYLRAHLAPPPTGSAAAAADGIPAMA